jgi:2-amino-4-hydroxy-6-hydroxymethyldihydropteridine diphosphokinase
MGGVARPVAIALGSNLGDRRAHLTYAIGRVRPLLDDAQVSSMRDTDPVEVPGPQPPYLNAVVVGRSPLAPRAWLERLLAIERDAGRVRPYHHAPRTLDLDLILCGDEIVREPDLVVPHPRFRDRAFVLEPLAEVAPDLVDPLTGLTVRELLARLQDPAGVSTTCRA